MQNNRIILKLSGEVLQGVKAFGISDEVITELAEEIVKLTQNNYEVGIVIGAGNFFRGAARAAENMNRVNADNIGMLGTLQNSIALNDKLMHLNEASEIFTSIKCGSIGKEFDHLSAKRALSEKKILIFAGGTGNPYFTTDTTAVLRALEVEADMVLKGTKVEGIYDKDPVKDSSAHLFNNISYDKYMELDLQVMDLTAIALAKKNQLPIKVFNIKNKENISRAVKENDFGSTIS
ncbi:MAG: UMP kinase [Candidatus Cloacimonetes bacterium]|nr:UMP kinase [Candidatus Cloacimonadota bacterium]MBS3766871.1 UMP kinase [Candidatus Cloacimonadota bacterium]